MRSLRRVIRFCRDLVRRRAVDADVAAELDAYVAERAERSIAAGATPADARRRALAEIGGATVMAGRLQDARPARAFVNRLDAIARDLRVGARRLVRTPRFSIPATLSLGLGMTLATCAFSLVDAFVLRPAPVPNGDRLLELAASRPTSSTLRYLSYPNYVDLRDHNTAFRDLAAYVIVESRLIAPGLSVPVSGQAVSGNYFPMFGARPWLGRVLGPTDDTAAAEPVVVVSDAFWKGSLASDPAVVGRTVRLDGRPFVIAGVAAEGFHGTDALFAPDVWIPMAKAAEAHMVTLDDRTSRGFRVQGFLAPGVDVRQAQANLDALTATLRAQYPVENRDLKTRVLPERDTRPIIDAAPLVLPMAAFLFGVTALGLLIDGASVTSLLLARGVAREREIAIRLALGATRARLFAQLLVESLLVAIAGGGISFALVSWILGALSRAGLPGGWTIDVHPDRALALFAAVLALGVGVAVGTWPAWRSARSNAPMALKDGAGGTSAIRAGRVRGQIVASQFAMLTVLLAIIAIVVGSVRTAARTDLGLETKDRWLLRVAPSEFGDDQAHGAQLVDALLARVRSLRGVRSAAAVYEPPFGFDSSSMELAPADPPAPIQPARVSETVVTPGYFETIGTPLVRGRTFTDADRATSPPVAVINEALATAFWPGEDAIGKRLVVPGEHGESASFDVVGVVKTGKYATASETPRPFVWFPYTQQYRGSMTLVVHVQGDASAVIAAARRALAGLDPAVALSDVTSFDALVHNRALGALTAAAAFVAIVGLISFVRATFGMYGLLSYAAALQTREIGIRLALGATTSTVVRLAVARGLRLAARGIAVGLVLAFVAARLLRGVLAGAASIAPSTWIGVPLLLVATALVASYLPIRRVLRANPLGALRHE